MGQIIGDPFQAFGIGQQIGASKYAGIGEFAKQLTEKVNQMDLLKAKSTFDTQGEIAKERALSPFRIEEAGAKAGAEARAKYESDPVAQYLMSGFGGNETGGGFGGGGGGGPQPPSGGGNDLLDAVRKERARRQSSSTQSTAGLAYAEEAPPEESAQQAPFGTQSQQPRQASFGERLNRIRGLLPPGSTYDIGSLKLSGMKERTPQQIAYEDQFKQISESINRIGQISHESGQGKFVQAGLPFSPGARILKFHLDNAATTLNYLKSGAQINEQEYARLRGLLPSGTDVIASFGEDVVGEKLKYFEDMISRIIQRQASRGWAPLDGTEEVESEDF